jgi:hypothetical protein
MVHVQYSDIIIATIAAFLFSLVYYIILGKQVAGSRSAYSGKSDAHKSMTPVRIIIEIVRTFVVGLFVAYAVALLNFLYIQQAILLAFWLWIAFPVVLLVGSVVHEHFPVKLAVIHGIDWLIKLLILTLILTLWR